MNISKDCPGGEMVDALVSGTSVSDDVKVRVLSWAPKTPLDGSLTGFPFLYPHLSLNRFWRVGFSYRFFFGS